MQIEKINREQAHEIALDAMENAGYDITDYSGYWNVWSYYDTDDDVDYAVAINKEQDENGNDKHFAIYVSISTDEGFWEYTDNLDVVELTEELLRIVQNIEIEEMKQRGNENII